MLAPLRDNPQRRPVIKSYAIPASVAGWNTFTGLAGMKPQQAVQLKNWFPQPGYVEFRRGFAEHATTVGISTTDVESLIAWNGPGSTRTMFAGAGGVIYNVTSAATAKPVLGGNDTYTKVLLHMDGSDTSTTFTDSNAGGSAHTWTAAGNAQLDTAESEFGTASGLFDGTGDWIAASDHADFALGSGDWTVDFWFNCTAASGSVENIAGQNDSSETATTKSFHIQRTAGNLIRGQAAVGSTVTTVTSTTQFTDAVNTGWHHVALVRSGDVLTLFIDGVEEDSDAITGTVNDSSNDLRIGAGGEVTTDPWTGWIDEFRLSVGIARWTEDFTPQALAYETLSSNRWQWVNMTTAAGAFLVIANGADSVRHYNGSVWVTPSITGVTSSNLVHVAVHKKRLWFTEINSTTAWYLPTEAVAGAATSFALGSHFSEGGYLVGIASWTRDGGAGADDFLAFISSRGQIAIYQGTDPDSALTWDLVGVFKVGIPIGRRCFANWGADVLLITETGVVPLSQMLGVDSSRQELLAISKNIAPSINAAVRSYGSNFGWELNVYPRSTRIMLNIPTTEGSAAKQYVMNTLTGAWCEFDGINALCWITFNGLQYFGGSDGTVYLSDSGSTDNGTTITATGQTAWQAFGSPGLLKRFTMVQPLVRTQGTSRPAVGISVDFVETTTLSSPAAASSAQALYGTAVYGTGVYGSLDVFSADYTSTPALGRFASVKFQATAESSTEIIMQVNGFVALAETGGPL